MKRFLIICVTMFMTVTGAIAQDAAVTGTSADRNVMKISEAQAVEIAIKNNLNLDISKSELETKKRTRDYMWNVLVPSVSATATFAREYAENPTSSNSYDTLNASTSYAMPTSIDVQLALTGQIFLGMMYAMEDYEKGLIDYEKARKDLNKGVRKQFYNLIMLRDSIDVFNLKVKATEKRLKQARTNYQYGLVDQYTVLSAEVGYENLKPALEEIKIGYETAQLAFKQMLGIDLSTPIEIDGSVALTPKTFNADNLVDQYLMNRLDIQSTMKSINEAKLQKKVLIAGLLPKVVIGYSTSPTLLNANKNFPYSSKDADWLDSRTLSATLTMSLSDLLPSSKAQVDIRNTQSRIDQAQDGLSLSLRGAELEIRSSVMKLNKAATSIRAMELNVDLAERAYKLAEESYNAGGKSLLDVEDAEDKLQEAKFDVLKEKVNYIGSLIDLESATNSSFTE